MLKISEQLSLPLETAACQTYAFIARKGAGKTYAAGKLTELLLDAGVQVVVLDTVGNWFGLRLTADGKHQAFDVPVFGGLRGDLPLDATAGELVADVAVDTGRSLVIDVSQFSLGDRKRFATSFGERLWRRKKSETHPSPLMLVIEESQLIVPQHVGRDEARMVGIYEEIIRLGRNYGIGVTMISQRPQSVNKEVLNQTECLFVLQVNGAQERKALRDWIVHQGMDVSLLNELPSLPVGTAYVWSPQWLGVLQKVRIAEKISFDASATPRVGQKQTRRELAPLDLKEIEQRMGAIVEKAKADDPRELKRRIAALEKQLAERPKEEIEKTVEKIVEVPVLKNGQLDRTEKLADRLQAFTDKFTAETQELRKLLAAAVAPRQAVAPKQAPARTAAQPQAVRRPATQPERPRREPSSEASDLGKCERSILAVLAQHPEGCASGKLTLLAGYRYSGGFKNSLSALRQAGYITGANTSVMAITPDGLAALGDYEPLPSGADLADYWLNHSSFGACERNILRALIDHPAGLTAEQICDATGYQYSGGFKNALSNLRTAGVIVGKNTEVMRASEDLFE